MTDFKHGKHVLLASVLSLGVAMAVSAQPAATSGGAAGSTSGTTGGSTPGSSSMSNGSASASRSATAGKSGSAAVSGADRKFVHEAASGGLAEVALGNLAQQKAASDQVKQFGSRLVQDHTKANDELMQIATGKGLQLPSAPDKKHQRDMDRLGKLSGAQFDKAFMSHMVADHKKDISDFKKESTGGKDADLKAFASKTLPTLQEHLQMAQTTNAAVAKGAR